MENFSELIKNRRSMRKFTDEELTQDEVVALMKAALMSPSSKRSNSWQFVVVDDKEMLEDIGNLDFDSNTLVLKITGGKFNQNIKTSDLTLSEEIAQYVKVSEVKVNKDGTEVSVILERTNTNYDDLVGTINVKPSGYSEGDIDLVANIKLLKTDRLPESINVKDEAVKFHCTQNTDSFHTPRIQIISRGSVQILSFRLNKTECPWHWEGDWIIPDTEDENVKEIELLVISQGGKLIKMNPRIFFS